MSEKPDFVRLPGDVVGMPPYEAHNALLQILLIKGDRSTQQDYVDLTLNHPSNGGVSFRAVNDHVLVTALYVSSIRSTDVLDGAKGVVQEWDIGFWTLISGGKTNGPERQGWLPSFMFVDTAAAMASGREIFGYPKSQATIEPAPGATPGNPSVKIKTLHFTDFGLNKRPGHTAIMSIEKAQAAGLADTPKLTSVMSDIGVEGLDKTEGATPPSPFTAMPQITLRQMRDPEMHGRATHQSILETILAPKNIAGIGPLDGRYDVVVQASRSHDIAKELGVNKGRNAVIGGGWVKFDFTIGQSRALWTA